MCERREHGTQRVAGRRTYGRNSIVCWRALRFAPASDAGSSLSTSSSTPFSGPSGALKERSIGVELFQLPQDFDTGQHTIVRVTANEVRKKLAQHYLAENGTYHPVRIDLPPGSYSAEFRWEAPPPAGCEAPPIQPRRSAETSRRLPSVWPRSVDALAPDAAGDAPWLLLDWRVAFAVVAVRDAVNPISVDAKSAPVFRRRPARGTGQSRSSDDRGLHRSLRRSQRAHMGPGSFLFGGNVLVRPSERIFRTLDPDIYRHLRSGDFRYDIPLQPGNYELHLFFAETGLADFISAESSGEGQRVFRVSANGNPTPDCIRCGG